LQVGLATVNRDISYLRNQAKCNIKSYIDERLLEKYEKCLVGLTAILREAWDTSQQTHDRREKIQALSLAKECYSIKLELLTNATVVDDAITLYHLISPKRIWNHRLTAVKMIKKNSNSRSYYNRKFLMLPIPILDKCHSKI
jgi:hypothetical protein